MIKSAIVTLAVRRNGIYVMRRNLGFKGTPRAKMLKIDSSEESLQGFSSFVGMDGSHCEQVVNELEKKSDSEASTKKNKTCRNKIKEGTREPPNCFLSIPIQNDQIKAKFIEIHNKMTENEPKLKSLMISVPTIHLTLKVYNLKEEDQIMSARKAMDEAKGKIMAFTKSLPLQLDVSGVGSFRNEVVFAKVVPGPQLDLIGRVAEELEESFKKNGLECTDPRPFTPHITILKLSRGKLSLKKPLKALLPDICETLKEEKFGSEIADRIDLCSMTAEKGPDGYYHILHQIKLADDGEEVLEHKEPL